MLHIEICDFADFPHWLPTVSGWFYQEWRGLYGEQTQFDVERRISAWLERDRIPTALVAVTGDEVVGIVALKDKELVEFAASPWLSGLFVAPRFRYHGIGGKLLRAAENKARSIGLRKLYLYSPSRTAHHFYSVYGWDVHRELPMAGGNAAIMEKLLMPQSFFQPSPPVSRG